jgi:hypothetical protein
MAQQAQVEKDSVNTGFDKTPDLLVRILCPGNRSQHQRMVKRDHEGSMPWFPQNSIEANLLADVSQKQPPGILNVQIIELIVHIRRSTCQFL